MTEIILVQCSLADNQYQQKSEELYTFMPNKSFAYLLHVEKRNLVNSQEVYYKPITLSLMILP